MLFPEIGFLGFEEIKNLIGSEVCISGAQGRHPGKTENHESHKCESGI